MNKEEIARYIDENLVTKQEAIQITGQSLTAFDQSLVTGRITPFYDHGENRSRVRLFHRDDLTVYADQVRARRRRLSDEIFTIRFDGQEKEAYDEKTAETIALQAVKDGNKEVTVSYFRAKDHQHAHYNPRGFEFEAENWVDYK